MGGKLLAGLHGIPRELCDEISRSENNHHSKLEVRRNFYHSLLDRPHHELSLVVNSQLAHEIELVGVNGLCAHSKNTGGRADGSALSQQFQDFALPSRQNSPWSRQRPGRLPAAAIFPGYFANA